MDAAYTLTAVNDDVKLQIAIAAASDGGLIASTEVDYVKYVSVPVRADFLLPELQKNYGIMLQHFGHALRVAHEVITLEHDLECFQPRLVFPMARETLTEMDELKIELKRSRDKIDRMAEELKRNRVKMGEMAEELKEAQAKIQALEKAPKYPTGRIEILCDREGRMWLRSGVDGLIKYFEEWALSVVRGWKPFGGHGFARCSDLSKVLFDYPYLHNYAGALEWMPVIPSLVERFPSHMKYADVFVDPPCWHAAGSTNPVRRSFEAICPSKKVAVLGLIDVYRS